MAMPSGVKRSVRSDWMVLEERESSFSASFSHSWREDRVRFAADRRTEAERQIFGPVLILETNKRLMVLEKDRGGRRVSRLLRLVAPSASWCRLQSCGCFLRILLEREASFPGSDIYLANCEATTHNTTPEPPSAGTTRKALSLNQWLLRMTNRQL